MDDRLTHDIEACIQQDRHSGKPVESIQQGMKTRIPFGFYLSLTFALKRSVLSM